MTFHIICECVANQNKLKIPVDKTMKIPELKASIAAVLNTHHSKIDLVLNKVRLEDNKVIRDYDIEKISKIHVVVGSNKVDVIYPDYLNLDIKQIRNGELNNSGFTKINSGMNFNFLCQTPRCKMYLETVANSSDRCSGCLLPGKLLSVGFFKCLWKVEGMRVVNSRVVKVDSKWFKIQGNDYCYNYDCKLGTWKEILFHVYDEECCGLKTFKISI